MILKLSLIYLTNYLLKYNNISSNILEEILNSEKKNFDLSHNANDINFIWS